MQHILSLGKYTIGNELPFALIAGPDSIESREHALFMARSIAEICAHHHVPYIFKASYDKANRTSVQSFRGVGIEEGMKILAEIRESVQVPVTSDVHTEAQATFAGKTLDVLQVPALLSRQTDLLVAAAATGKVVNVKKGQFVAPHNVDAIIGKVESTGSDKLMLTERGYMFGYNDVVADMRSIAIMKEYGYPVIFDASHTVQYPSSSGTVSGGKRELTPPLARAAIGVGVAGIFIETHDRPEEAKVDGPSSLRLSDLDALLGVLTQIDRIVKS